MARHDPLMTSRATSEAPSLGTIARVFTVLGATSVGGPAAHVALLREEVVVRRRWVSEERFVALLGVVNLLPGPNSTELAIHLGKDLAGMRGLAVAGLGFVLPGALITSAAAYAYVHAGARPELAAIFYGVKPVVAAIVAHAIVGLAPTTLRRVPARVVGGLGVVAAYAGLHELALLVACGALHAALENSSGSKRSLRAVAPPLIAVAAGTGATVTAPVSAIAIFGAFGKIGSVLYGSGYVLLAFLRTELVERRGWISEAQLLDAVAVGQATPGPVFTTATFLGFVLGGAGGACAATAGIFAPAFAFVALADPLTHTLRRSRVGAAFLEGVNVASLALMMHVAITLSRAAVVDPVTGVLAAGAGLALFTRRATATQALAVGALVGLAARSG